ncbi:MAG: hypothetical protein AB1420_04810 [Bacillota bacterium]
MNKTLNMREKYHEQINSRKGLNQYFSWLKELLFVSFAAVSGAAGKSARTICLPWIPLQPKCLIYHWGTRK